MPPLALLPVGLTGWRPPLVRPSPPPCGWSIGFIAVPRTCGRRPSQRRRPALPHTIALRSGLPVVPDRCPASGGNAANFTTRQRNLRPTGFAGHERGAGAGTAAERAAATGLQFDVVDRRAQRNLRQRQAIADVRRRIVAAHHRVASLQAVRRDDVPLLAVDVIQQRDAGRSDSDRTGSNRPWPECRLCCGGSRSADNDACARRHGCRDGDLALVVAAARLGLAGAAATSPAWRPASARRNR